ncbi:MAG: hypothetical protein IPK97_20965 [Ahniella sp.]|nr:hypothetical protein [Ahniella sp.]
MILGPSVVHSLVYESVATSNSGADATNSTAIEDASACWQDTHIVIARMARSDFAWTSLKGSSNARNRRIWGDVMAPAAQTGDPALVI